MNSEDLNEVKFRGSQYLIMDDIIKIVQPTFSALNYSTLKKHFIDATIEWQHINNQPIGPIRMADPEIRRKCVADILSNFERRLMKNYKLDKNVLKHKIKEGMDHFETTYMNRDDYC